MYFTPSSLRVVAFKVSSACSRILLGVLFRFMTRGVSGGWSVRTVMFLSGTERRGLAHELIWWITSITELFSSFRITFFM